MSKIDIVGKGNMNLLLTSNGLANRAIAKALFELVGKKPEKTKIAFIPTAANIDESDKRWLVEDLYNIKKQKIQFLDIVDISALPKKIWLPRLKQSDVLFFSGGYASHLMYWLKKSGLAKVLPALLKTRVYAGISAGSIVAAPTLQISNKAKRIYYKKTFGYKNKKGLGLVNFHIRPHFNSSHFPHARKKYIITEIVKENIKEPVYAIDDETAIKVMGKDTQIVTEKGNYMVFGK